MVVVVVVVVVVGNAVSRIECIVDMPDALEQAKATCYQYPVSKVLEIFGLSYLNSFVIQ